MMYCVMLHGLLLCCCCCDCVFPLHVLVRFVLLSLFVVLWFVFALCFVVLECVLFCLSCLCVSFVVYCETLHVLFVRAFRVCVFFYMCLCVIFAIYCVMLSGVFVFVFCVNMCA